MREVWIRLDLSWTGLICCFYKADICDRCEMYRIFEAERPDVVVNFCGRVACGQIYRYPGGVP